MTTTPDPKVNLIPSTKRMVLGNQALPSLNTFQGLIFEESRTELQFPASVTTYQKMGMEANLASAISVFEMMISRVSWRIETPETAPEEEKERAKLLNKNLHMLDRPWEEYVNEFTSILQYGFCPMEKVYQRTTIDGTPLVAWKHFPVISQPSVKNWYFDDKTGSLKGLEQDVTNLNERAPTSNRAYEKPIGRHKFMLFRHNPKRDNPEGTSPLRNCYVTWKYLQVIEEFEAIGVAKDTGGIAVFEIDQNYFQKAYDDPDGFEAKNLADLERYAASMTAGDQSYLFIPMSYDDQGKPLFSFRLQGIEGGGKQYNTDEIATRHANKLLMTFFADVLKLGSDSHGSFSLAETKTSLLAMAIESIMSNLKRTLNHDLMRQTYELNEWEYDPFTSAKFEFGDLEDQDLEILAGAIQRVMAVGAMRPTSDIEDALREKTLNLPPMKEAKPEILETEVTSRSSDGMKKGLNDGVGDSTSKGKDRTKGNKSNK